MEYRILPLAIQMLNEQVTTEAESSRTSLSASMAFKSLIVGGATVAYVFSASPQAAEMVRVFTPSSSSERYAVQAHQREHADLGDWAPGFDEPLRSETTYAELAVAFERRGLTPLPAGEAFDMPDDLY